MKNVSWARRCLQLTCGDPWSGERPATFSRFFFPLGWQLVAASNDTRKSNQYYKEIPPKKACDGRAYFTFETEEVLYNRAVWAELQVWKPVSFPFTPKGSGLLPARITIAPPRIVLFEEKTAWRRHQEGSPLHNGILVVEAYFEEPRDENDRKPDLDDLLLFNDFFRFFKRPYEQHGRDFKKYFPAMPVAFKDSEDKTVGDCIGQAEGCYFKRWQELLALPLEMENGERFLLHPDLEKQQNGASRNYLIYDDNRTFVWSCAVLDGGSQALGLAFKKTMADPENFGHWIKFLNVDPPGTSPLATHSSSAFEKEWARPRTYTRWLNYGSLFGFNYHSGVMLGPSKQDSPVWRHFGEMYCDQALLLFYIRITLFRFSRDLTKITKVSRDNPNLDKDLDEFQALHRQFAEFTNLYQYPLISNQQQGIEMYSKARKYLDLDDFYKEIRSEIISTHEFLETRTTNQLNRHTLELNRHTHKLNRKANLIAVVGLPLAFIGLTLTILGMEPGLAESVWGCLTNGSSCTPRLDFLIPVALFSLLSLLICYLVVCWVSKMGIHCLNKKKRE